LRTNNRIDKSRKIDGKETKKMLISEKTNRREEDVGNKEETQR